MADDKPIIVIQKKGGHGGHHGGAWKIAYADFVTAMMAFFMVMWLVNSASVQTKESIASYFRKPGLFNEGSGTPLLLGGAGILEDAYVPPKPEDKVKFKKGTSQEPQKEAHGDQQSMQRATQGKKTGGSGDGDEQPVGSAIKSGEKGDLVRAERAKKRAEVAEFEMKKLLGIPQLQEMLGKLDIKIEDGALILEIVDTDKTSMFNSGSAVIKPEATEAFKKIAGVLKGFSYPLEVIGHTDAKPFGSRTGAYSNWELSADRANTARRVLEREGIPGANFKSVTGKAASELKTPETPEASSNRRITLKMDFKQDPLASSDTKVDTIEKANQLLSHPPGQPPVEPEEYGPAAPTATPTPRPTPTTRPTATPGIPGAIKLSDEPAPTTNPNFMEKDKIFGNSPVVGPSEMFSGR